MMQKTSDSKTPPGIFLKIKMLIIKFFKNESLSYLFFGGLTTLISLVVYEIFFGFIPSAVAANTASSIVGVVFAFVTNKLWVFRTDKKTATEFFKFVAGRIFMFFVETGILFAAVDIMKYDKTVMKIITTVIVIVSNYFISKLIVFKK